MNESEAQEVLSRITVAAVMYREKFGRDAAVRAGCMESVLTLARSFGFQLTPENEAELRDFILGHDETDDVLAGILAVSA